MNTHTLKEIIRRKAELETGAITPGRVTEITFDAKGKSVVKRHNPEVWQKKQADAQATRIAEARAKLHLTQAEFATMLGISRRTVENWEQGHRAPTGAARILIDVATKHPEIVLEAVA